MNPDQPSREQIEARITALLLGELPAAEASLLRYTISQDPDLQQLHDQLQSALPLVREAAKQPGELPAEKSAPLKLSTDRREKLLAHFKTSRPAAAEKDIGARTALSASFKRPSAAEKNPLFWLKPIRVPSLIETLVIVAVIAMLAALMLPVLSSTKARSTSRANAVINNLRQIDAAKAEWALEKGKTASDTPTPADLAPYLKNGKVPTVMGETYKLGTVSESPSASVADRQIITLPGQTVITGHLESGPTESSFSSDSAATPPPQNAGSTITVAENEKRNSLEYYLKKPRDTGVRALTLGDTVTPGHSLDGPAVTFGLAPTANPTPSSAPQVATLAPEPALAPPPKTVPPAQIVLPQIEQAPEIDPQTGLPIEAGEAKVYSQNIVGYVNVPTVQAGKAFYNAVPMESQGTPESRAAGGLAYNSSTDRGGAGGAGGIGGGGGSQQNNGAVVGVVNAFAGASGFRNSGQGGGSGGGGIPAVNQSSAATLAQDGKMLYEMGRFDDARAKLSEAQKLDPGNPTAAYYGAEIAQIQLQKETIQHNTDTQSREERVEKQWILPKPDAASTPNSGGLATITGALQERSMPQAGATFGSQTAAPATPQAVPTEAPVTLAINERSPPPPAHAPDSSGLNWYFQQQNVTGNGGSTPTTGGTALATPPAATFAFSAGKDSFDTGLTPENVDQLRDLTRKEPAQADSDGHSDNHFVSRYAYKEITSTNYVQPPQMAAGALASGVGGNNTFSPGTSAIEPKMEGLNEALDRYAKLTGRTVLRAGVPENREIQVIEFPDSISAPKELEIHMLEMALAQNGVSVANLGDKFAKAIPAGQAGTAGGEIDQKSLPANPEVATTVPTPTLDAEQLGMINSQRIEGEKIYNEQLVQLRELESLKTSNPDKLTEVLPQVVQDSALNDLLAKRNDAKQNLAKIGNDYAVDSSSARRAKSLVDELDREIGDRTTGIMAGLESRVNATKAALDGYDKEVDDAKKKDQEEAVRNQPYYEAKRDLDQKMKMHELLYSKLNAEKLDLTLPQSSMVQITDPAEPGKSKNTWDRITGQVESTARIKVENDVTDIQGVNSNPTYTEFDPYFIQNTFEIMQSPPVLGKVVDALNLQSAWAQDNGGQKLEKAQAIQLLKNRLSFQPIKNTKLIAISAKSRDPKEAANIANAVAEAYRAYRFESRRLMATNGVAVLEDQFAQQAKEIQVAQANVDRLGQELSLTTETKPAEPDLPLRKPAPNTPLPQPEILTSSNNFSTFSLNVSDVSFKLAQASLQNGKLPDTASIRSEEFINAFDYRDPEAAPGQPLAFASERARYPFAHNRELLRFAVKTAAVGRQEGRALNLVLLLDISGSMERADRVAIIHQALQVLATQLQPQDTVSVVTFARTARLWADGVTGDKAAETLERVGEITPEGGTNLEEAMRLAYETAHRHYLASGINRVELLTDGAANLGNVDPGDLTQKVDAQRKQGINLDCFGIGWEDYNDTLLERLSSNGDGRYAFLNSPEDAARDFAAKLAGALQIAAADVKVQVEFNPQRVTAYRQIGYATHQLTKEQFRDNTVAAGQMAAQESGNALYTIETNPGGEGPIATVHVRYNIPGTSEYRETSWDVPYTGTAPALEQTSSAMRLAATASAFSEWLAANPYAQTVSLDELLRYLTGVPEVYGADDRPKQLETMIREAKSLEGK